MPYRIIDLKKSDYIFDTTRFARCYTFAVDMNTVLQRLWYGCNMSALGERSVRIREVEGSNPFRSTKNKPPARVDLFLLRPAGVEVYPPLRGKSLQVHQK